jgi:DNA-binding LacI/PurR family transcriptional regulator
MVNRIAMVTDGKPPTQRDVARRAGVSTATVSYILSGRRGRMNPVAAETRQRVLDVARDLGYQRNHAARSLRRRRTEFVCVVHPTPSGPWVERLTEQLHVAAAQHGYGVITMPVGRGDRVGSLLRMLREQYVDGAVLAPGHAVPEGELGRLAANGQGLVVFDDNVVPDGFDVVRQLQAPACYCAMELLIRKGHQRIAYFGHGDPSGPPDVDTKHASYRAALTNNGIPVDDSLVVAAADFRTAAHLATVDLLRRPDPPTAVFSASDRGGIAAIGAARQSGRSVPADLAVIGVGNTHEGEVIAPALTSVGTPTFDFTVVVERLLERVITKAPMPGIELSQPWELISRQSA